MEKNRFKVNDYDNALEISYRNTRENSFVWVRKGDCFLHFDRMAINTLDLDELIESLKSIKQKILERS